MYLIGTQVIMLILSCTGSCFVSKAIEGLHTVNSKIFVRVSFS